MNFRVVGRITQVRTFASGQGIREVTRLRRTYGNGRWRKRKGIAKVQFEDGTIRNVEVHWYEASGIGRMEFKIKGFLD